MREFKTLLAVLILLTMPAMLFAWGGDGHQIVCLIAEDRLTPAAKAGIHKILGDNVNISDAEIANWADQIRRDRTETGPWHYVDIPIGADGYDATRDGQNGNNVIDKIYDFVKVLQDPNAEKKDRVEALKFLVHFVGDIHQPLHCAERNGDKGGNTRLVFFPDQRKAVNLHQCWDSWILLNDKGDKRDLDYSNDLNKKITKQQAEQWAKGTPVDWANESFHLANDVAYKDIPMDGDPPRIDQAYLTRATPVVEEQLEKGGVRLAMILNKIFSN